MKTEKYGNKRARIIFERLYDFLRNKRVNIDDMSQSVSSEYVTEKYKIAFVNNSYRGIDHKINVFMKNPSNTWTLCLVAKLNSFGCSSGVLTNWTVDFIQQRKHLKYVDNYKNEEDYG